MKLNMKTLKNLKLDMMVYIALLILGALICVAVGVSIGGGAGAGVGAIGFAVCAYIAYSLATDPKNQKTCNASYFIVNEGVKNPIDPNEADTELDVTLCTAQKNAQYGGYAGVWTTSNASTTAGNIDAYYIPFSDDDETTTIRLTRGVITEKNYGTAHTKKGSKDDPGPRIVMPSPTPGGSPPM